MIQQDIIKNLSNSLTYFSSLSPQKVQPKSFQQNINFIQAFISNRQISSTCPKQFLDNIFTILVSKYYQLYSQNISIISQQYLQNKYVNLIKTLYQQFMDKSKLQKNIYALCLSANINKLKQEITTNLKNNQTVITLFKFNLSLIAQITTRNDYKIIQYYPRCMSLLSNTLRKQNISLKIFEVILQTMKTLIFRNQYFQAVINQQSYSQFNIKFEQQSLKRLIDDVEYLINIYHKLQPMLKFKLKPFSQFLINFYQPNNQNYQQQQLQQLQSIFNNPNQINVSLKNKLFSLIILLAQMNQIDIKLELYQFLQIQTIKQSYRQLFVATCRQIKKIQVNVQSKKQHINKLIYLISFVYITQQETDQITHIFHQLINHLFHIGKNHSLISIPHHASTIPLENIQPNHTKQNYPIKNISVEHEKQFTRMLIQIIPFYELEIQVISLIKRLFERLNQNSRYSLLRYFSDLLLEQQYQLDMSLTKLYKYLSILLAIKYIVTTSPPSFRWYQIAYSIFQVLGSKSDSVKKLKASYIQEQLLISATLQLIYYSYQELKTNYKQQVSITNKIKLTQSTIIFFQKILNSLSEQSYLIRLITISSILQFTEAQCISQSLLPIQAALIHRNKNNLELMLNILSLSVLNQIDYEQLADYYMSHKNCQIVLRKLLLKISVQSCRKCLLTVQKWWLLLTAEIIEYLNNKQMKKSQNQDSFYVKDGQNVVIKNALGVIILQLSSKWIFYLQTQKRQAIIDIILQMSKINPNMVFFKSNFNSIIKQLTNIIHSCLGFQPETINKHSKKKQKQNKAILTNQKIDFYDRLRLKIYEIFINIPKDSFIIYEKEHLNNLSEILQKRHDEVKKDYLFNEKHQLKRQYELGKMILEKFQN